MKALPWYERPRLDHLLVGSVVAAHIAIVWRWGMGDVLMWADADHRGSLYRMLASSSSLLLTVGAAAMALYVGGGGRRLAWFRREHGTQGLAIMFSVVPALLGLVAISVIAYVIDVGGRGDVVRWLVEYAVLLVAWRIVRVGLVYRDQLEGQLHDSVDDHQRREVSRRS